MVVDVAASKRQEVSWQHLVWQDLQKINKKKTGSIEISPYTLTSVKVELLQFARRGVVVVRVYMFMLW